MPKPILVIYCTVCASPYLLDLARRREAAGLPVEYHIHTLCRRWAEARRLASWEPSRNQQH